MKTKQMRKGLKTMKPGSKRGRKGKGDLTAKGTKGAKGGGPVGTPGPTSPLAGMVWVVEMNREWIFASPTNPRKDFPEEMLAERGESLKRAGQLVNLIVRPRPECLAKRIKSLNGRKEHQLEKKEAAELGVLEVLAGQAVLAAPPTFEEVAAVLASPWMEFEIADGECRWRASAPKYGDLKALKCDVRVLSDEDVTEIQWASFVQRKDLNPLEEAEGLAKLKAAGWSIEKMCEKTGKSRTQLFEKLKLARAEGPVRELVAEGKISVSVAAIVASVPDKKVQAKIIEGVVFDYDGQARPVLDVQAEIEERFMRSLKHGGWDLTEAFDHRGAVAAKCAECPCNTRNMGELNPDLVKGPARCMGLECFDARQKFAHLQMKDRLTKEGFEVWDENTYRRKSGGDEFFAEGRDVYLDGKWVKGEKVAGKEKHRIVAITTDGVKRVWRRADLEAAGVVEADKSVEQDRMAAEKQERESVMFDFVKAEALKRVLCGLKGEVALERELVELQVLRGHGEAMTWRDEEKKAFATAPRYDLFAKMVEEVLQRWYRGADDFPPLLHRLGVRLDVLKETAKDAFAEHERFMKEKAAAKAAKKKGKRGSTTEDTESTEKEEVEAGR